MTNLTRAAIHEAAHVAVAHRLRIPVVSVQIGDENFVDHGPTLGQYPAGHVALVRFAGPMADVRAFGFKVAAENPNEILEISAVLHLLAREAGLDPKGVIDFARKIVNRILDARWQRVLALADELNRRGSLTGTDAFRYFE